MWTLSIFLEITKNQSASVNQYWHRQVSIWSMLTPREAKLPSHGADSAQRPITCQCHSPLFLAYTFSFHCFFIFLSQLSLSHLPINYDKLKGKQTCRSLWFPLWQPPCPQTSLCCSKLDILIHWHWKIQRNPFPKAPH